ncbi:hypothetical protein KOI35_26125 [Actinoplanes bogorensis]|uniref:T3SS peptide-binding chaperone domain-containing protein n=1 Tax=Paractinoplanes bogorensis TaxID=1610840 RepID=A0ABS5YWA0_9ACTN|nr:hypothetical protein [Actinoplanes bogorensis]MBU2666994.1 hypothetical protein [Actinoplanes bogorensis]
MLLVEPAPRIGEAQLWWIAATLARRHPGLTVVEAVRPPGAGDCLTLLRGSDVVASLEMSGHLHTGGWAGLPITPAFDAPDPMHMVTFVEKAAGLTSPRKTPAATPGTLMYRVAAALVALTANDRARLQVRAELSDLTDGVAQVRGGVLDFAPAAERIATMADEDDPLAWVQRFWHVVRDGETVALLDTDGYAYGKDQAYSMPEIYAEHDRKVHAVLHTCFSEFLN